MKIVDGVVEGVVYHNGPLFTNSLGITSLGSIKEVHGSLTINSKDFKSLGNLEEVSDHLEFNTQYEIDWGNLSYVGRSLYLVGNPTKYIKKDLYVEQNLYIPNSGVCTLLNLDWDGSKKVQISFTYGCTLGQLQEEERVIRAKSVSELTEMANDPSLLGGFFKNVITDELGK